MASSLPLNGYLYIAFGEEHRGEALQSLQSLRKVDSKSHVTIITESPIHGFDKTIISPKVLGFRGKAENLKIVYQNTFFVDTDTYFCEDCSDLFDLLKYFDICAMVDPAETELQTGIQSLNTGVLLYQDNYRTRRFFELFKKYYNTPSLFESLMKNHPAGHQGTDQPFFTLAVRDSEVRLWPLPNTCNARYRFNISLMGKVRLIHGNTTNFEELKKEMDKRLGNRCWNQKNDKR